LFYPLDFVGVPLCPRNLHYDVWVTRALVFNGNPHLVQYFGLDFSNVWAPFYEEPNVDLGEIPFFVGMMIQHYAIFQHSFIFIEIETSFMNITL
jgi:hypothetical protein